MSVARVSRTSYHHGNLEEALITSAIKLIRRHGPDNLSLRAVASELGVSPSAAYHYFPDKDSLVHGIGDHLFTELTQMMEKSLEKFPGKNIKATKLKIQASIQGEQVRVTGKDKDDLQAVIQNLRKNEDKYDVPLQFTNYR